MSDYDVDEIIFPEEFHKYKNQKYIQNVFKAISSEDKYNKFMQNDDLELFKDYLLLLKLLYKKKLYEKKII